MTWDLNATSLYGLSAAAAPASAHVDTSPGLAVSAGPSMIRSAAAWSPNHPLFWLAGIGLLTIGAIGAAGSSSGSIRLGKARLHAGVNAGAGKS